MKAVRLHKPGILKMSDEPMPRAGVGEVLLRVKSVGVCASDIHYFQEGAIGDQVIQNPLVLGHEIGAEVVELGPGVTSLRVGDRVAVEPGHPCAECAVCKKGLINLCPDVVFFGTPPVDGAMREYVAWSASLCLKIPDSMTLDEAAMTEPMAVGIYALDLADLKGGESVAILGAGGIGLSVLQAAKNMGAGKTVVIEPIPERAEIAAKLGADQTFSGSPEDAIETIWFQSGNIGIDAVFECAGTNDAVQQAIRLAAYNGQVIISGIPYPDSVSFTASIPRRKNLTIKFVRRSRNAVERAIEWAKDGKINLGAMVTHHFTLENAEEAFRLARDKQNGVIRAVINL